MNMLCVRIYFDTADLNSLADNPELAQSWIDVLHLTASVVLISDAHLADWAGAQEDTRHRIADLLNGLPVLYIVPCGEDSWTLSPDNAHAIFERARPRLALLRTVMEQLRPRYERENRNTVDWRKVPRRERERFLDWALAKLPETVTQVLGVSKADVRRLMTEDASKTLKSGDPGRYVYMRRREDPCRRNRISDIMDERHVQYAGCADIATVDSNVRHYILGKAFRGWGLPRTARGVVVIETGNLPEVCKSSPRHVVTDAA